MKIFVYLNILTVGVGSKTTVYGPWLSFKRSNTTGNIKIAVGIQRDL
jgi:hypothetical protein